MSSEDINAIEANAREVVDGFFTNLRHCYDTPPTNPLDSFHDDIVFTVTGQTPMSKTNNGKKVIEEGHAKAEEAMFVPPPGYDMYPLEWIVEGDRVCLVGRVRLETMKTGLPYNNTYFFYFRVQDNKLIHIIENIDESMGMTVPFDTHLEPN